MTNTKINFPTQIDLEQFISVEAHDLRTPFNHITGFGKMLLNTVGDAPLTDLQKEDLATVYRSGMRALTLMNGLIDIARLNRHEKEIQMGDVNIQQLMDRSLGQWKKFHPGVNAQIEYSILTESTSLQGDEPILQQIVSGFISFVIQYCESNIKVLITVEEEPGWSILTFKSIGRKANLASELDLEMLGYINRVLVEEHKGEIRQAEENDEGAMVQFVLPKA